MPVRGADFDDPRDPESLARLSELAQPLKDGANIVVHCAAGLHRTGAASYTLLRLAGWTCEEVI